METLKANQIKKGDKIFVLGAWNFHYGFEKLQDAEKINGKWVYTPHTTDIYRIGEVIVHSCGAKRMYLLDENGMKGASISVKQNGMFDEYEFTKTREEAEIRIKELFEQDTRSIATEYKIIEANFVH